MCRGSALPLPRPNYYTTTYAILYVYLFIELICSNRYDFWYSEFCVNSIYRRLDVIYIVMSVLYFGWCEPDNTAISFDSYTELAKIRLSAIKFFLSTLSIFLLVQRCVFRWIFVYVFGHNQTVADCLECKCTGSITKPDDYFAFVVRWEP